MNGRTHLGVGLAAGAVTEMSGGGPDGWQWLALAVGSVAPDLDGNCGLMKPSFWLPRFIPVPGFMDKIGEAVGRIPGRFFGHRHALHFPLSGFCLWLWGAYSGIAWLRWLAVGYLLHLLADSFTKQGIQWLGPFSSHYFRLLPRALALRTDGFVDNLISFLVWALVWLLVPLALLRG